MSRMLAVDFEVFGIVQGVFFRKVSKASVNWRAFVQRLDDRSRHLRLPETRSRVRAEEPRSPRSPRTSRLLARDISRVSLRCSIDLTDFRIIYREHERILFARGIKQYTQKRGKELGLKGWCMNTPNGTVVGHLEGEKARIEEMKQWLRHTGSPQSRIDKAEFRNEKEISQPSFSNFDIRK